MATLRQTIAKLVARTRPTLFYYHVPRDKRHGIVARRNGGLLEIFRAETRQLIRINTGNAVHLPDMVLSFDYYAQSCEPVEFRYRGEIVRLTDFSAPRLHRVKGFDDFAVLCPSSTEPFTTTRQYLEFAGLTPGDVALDLGAYCGLTSIALSKAVGHKGRVIALEPDPINFAAALVNVRRHAEVNGLDNIVLSEIAAADRDGTMAMSSEGTMGSALGALVGDYRGHMLDVPTRSLAGIAREFALDRIDLVKIDIEGAEKLVLPAAGDFLGRFRPRLIIETHVIGGENTRPAVVRFLEEVGYAFRIEAQEGLPFELIMAWPVDRDA